MLRQTEVAGSEQELYGVPKNLLSQNESYPESKNKSYKPGTQKIDWWLPMGGSGRGPTGSLGLADANWYIQNE